MATDRLVEVNDDYYYVNSTGAVITNEWKSVPNDSPSEGEPDEWWYYFQSNGKAVKAVRRQYCETGFPAGQVWNRKIHF